MMKKWGIIITVLLLIFVVYGTSRINHIETQKYTMKSIDISNSLSYANKVKMDIKEHYLRYGEMPSDSHELGIVVESLDRSADSPIKNIFIREGGYIELEYSKRVGLGRSMFLKPIVSETGSRITWECLSYTLPKRVLEEMLPPCTYLASETIAREQGVPITEMSSPESVADSDKDLSRGGQENNNSDISELVTAIRSGKINKALDIIDTGIDVNLSLDGDTPLTLAVKRRDHKLINALVVMGADPDMPSGRYWGKTPFMMVAEKRDALLLKLFLENGATMDKTDDKGKTVLMYAAESGRGDTVEFLLDAGADPEAEDEKGKKAVDYASENRRSRAYKILNALRTEKELSF